MKYYYLLLCIFITPFIYSQNIPDYNTEFKPSFWHNPSSYGAWSSFSSNLVYRGGTFGLTNPSHSLMIKMEGQLFKGQKEENNLLNLGVGGNLILDHQGYYNTQIVSFNLNNSFQIGNTYFSVGVAPGIRRVQSLIETNSINRKGSVFTLGAGMMWYGDQHYIGFSATNLLGNGKINDTGYENHINYYLNGGYKFKFNKFNLFPSMEVRYIHDEYIDGQLMTYFQFAKEIVSIGVGSNFHDKVIGGLGITINRLNFMYNLNYGVNKFSKSAVAFHELRFSYSIASK